MFDSIDVLATLKLVYTIYAIIAISIVARFAMLLTKSKEVKGKSKTGLFWAYVVILAVVGTGLHLLTYQVVPWVPMDLDRASIEAHETYEIRYKDHKMTFSQNPMRVECGKHVVFNAISEDLTYGFGIFRSDHTMVTQMQVVPHNRNDLMWKFHKNGTYYVRSTEYSGPKGHKMISENAVVVTGCDESEKAGGN